MLTAVACCVWGPLPLVAILIGRGPNERLVRGTFDSHILPTRREISSLLSSAYCVRFEMTSQVPLPCNGICHTTNRISLNNDYWVTLRTLSRDVYDKAHRFTVATGEVHGQLFSKTLYRSPNQSFA